MTHQELALRIPERRPRTLAVAAPMREPRELPWLLGALALVLYVLISFSRHYLYESGEDLGIFTQAIRHYAEFGAPVSEIKGAAYNLLGDHFHPILMAVAPLYRLFPSPYTVLFTQALAVALSVVVVTRIARRHLGARDAVLIGTAYACSWGLVNLVSFDFHEVAFALPFLALALEAYLEQRWTACAAWAAPLVLVKENLGLTVAAFGLLLAWSGQRRIGAALVAFGAAWTLAIVGLVIPHFNPAGGYAYWALVRAGAGAATPHTSISALIEIMSSPGRIGSLLIVFLPTLFLALRSPIIAVVVPHLAFRFVTQDPAQWGVLYHYHGELMVVTFIAAIDVMARARAAAGPDALNAVPARMLAVASVNLALILGAAGYMLGAPRSGERLAAARAAVAAVPSGARVIADEPLAQHLLARATVSTLRSDLTSHVGMAIDADWVVLDTRSRSTTITGGERQIVLAARLTACGFRETFTEQGYIVLARGAAPRPLDCLRSAGAVVTGSTR